MKEKFFWLEIYGKVLVAPPFGLYDVIAPLILSVYYTWNDKFGVVDIEWGG